MDASRLLVTGLPCDLCGEKIPEGSGVLARMKKSVKLCSGCLRAMVRAHEGLEMVEMIEVRGVFYAPGEAPLPPPLERTPGARRPNVVYDSPQEERSQEPLKYNPRIPPRRKPG